MFKTFEILSDIDQSIDRVPFMLRHKLCNHPVFSMDSLAKIILDLPDYQVMYSKGLNDLGINFDKSHLEHRNGLTLSETINNMKTSDSYIAVKNPEAHPDFKPLFDEFTQDIRSLLKSQGLDEKVVEPRFWLFIASPNAMTPFHFDRYSNYLLQIRGSKQLAVFPPMNDNVIRPEDYESYFDETEERPAWRDSIDEYATKFNIVPGDMIHIPFVSGHYVKNGPEDISITISYFFHNKYTLEKSKAFQVNHRIRKKMKLIGLVPVSIGRSVRGDKIKALIHPLTTFVGRVLGKIKSWIK